MIENMRNLLWLMPNKTYKFSGVYKYNDELINLLKDKKKIKILYCGKSNILFNIFWSKFFLIPFFLFFFSRNYDEIIYPEEGFAFLKFFSFAKKNKIIIHDYRKKFNDDNKIQRIEILKQIYLNFNFLFLRGFDKIITPSIFTQKLLSQNFLNIKKKIKVIPNIIDVERKKTKVTRSKFKHLDKIKKKFKIIITVTSKETRKNIKLIYRLAKKTVNIKFILIGNFKDNEKKKNIFFYKDLSEDDLAYLFEISDMYLHPSLFEGFGRTLIEAQNFGLPVVCYNTEINKEILGSSGNYLNLNLSDHQIINYILKKKYKKNEKNEILKNSKRYSKEYIKKKFINNINEI